MPTPTKATAVGWEPTASHLSSIRTGRSKGYCITDAGRFMEKVSKVGRCWEWTGCINNAGYGVFSRRGHKVYAHRFMVEATQGPIAEGMVIDHLCRNTRCVKPEHLEVVTPRTNVARGNSPAWIAHRTDTCIRGHDLNKHAVRSRTGRQCGLCMRMTPAQRRTVAA